MTFLARRVAGVVLVGALAVCAPAAERSTAAGAATSHRHIVFLPGICPRSESYGTGNLTGWLTNCNGNINAAARARATFALLLSRLAQSHAAFTPEYFSYSSSNPNTYTATDTHYVGLAASALRVQMKRIVHLDPSATVDLVGHSLGGVVASYWLSTWAHTDNLVGHVHSVVTFDSPVQGIHGSLSNSALAKLTGTATTYDLRPKGPIVRSIGDRQHGAVASLPGHVFTVSNKLDGVVLYCDSQLSGARENRALSERVETMALSAKITGCASKPETFTATKTIPGSEIDSYNHGAVLHDPDLAQYAIQHWLTMLNPAKQTVPTTDVLTANLACGSSGHVTNGVYPGSAPILSRTSTISIVKSGSIPFNHFLGYAVYRTWSTPHWLQVEDTGAAAICQGPWSNGAGAEVATYSSRSPFGPSLPRGVYHLAVLLAPMPNITEYSHRPHHTLYAELSSRTFELPLAPGHYLALWQCSPGATGKCTSSLFPR